MTRTTSSESAHPTRMSLREQRNKLTLHGLDDKNFYYRWFTDRDDRLASCLRAGYVFVLKSELPGQFGGDLDVETSEGADSRISRAVGGGRKGWLMKIPLDIRAIYELEKEADILETERAMRSSKYKTQHPASPDADIVNVSVESVRGRPRKGQ